MKIFVAEFERGHRVELVGESRVDAVALEKEVLPESVTLFVHHVQTGGEVFTDGLAGIEGITLVGPGSGLHRRLIDPLAVRFLQGAVEEAAAGAAPERDRTRPF